MCECCLGEAREADNPEFSREYSPRRRAIGHRALTFLDERAGAETVLHLALHASLEGPPRVWRHIHNTPAPTGFVVAMLLLVVYVLVAPGFSFLCSIAEAVILSVATAYISVLEQEDRPSGSLLRKLKEEINSTLAAVLTLNTIAHTVGAAGAGAQAAVVLVNAAVGIASKGPSRDCSEHHATFRPAWLEPPRSTSDTACRSSLSYYS